MWKEVAAAIVVIIIVSFIYSKYLESQKDIHELALSSQSDISPTRKPNETSIYRNNQVPHGMPLATGLQIRQGYRIRDGNLRDIWSVVMSSSKPIEVEFIDENVKLNNLQINFGIKQLFKVFHSLSAVKIGTLTPITNSIGFLSFFTCFINGITIENFSSINNNLVRLDLDSELDLLILDESQTKKIANLANRPKNTIIIYEDFILINENKKIMKGDLFKVEDSEFEYEYDPEFDKIMPLIDHSLQKTGYTQRNIVSAVSSIVKTIPIGHEFNQEDRSLFIIEEKNNTIHCLPKLLTMLLFRAKISFIKDTSFFDNNCDKVNPVLIEKMSPTIIATSSQFAKKLLLLETTFVGELFQKRSEYLLSEGIFTKKSSVQEFNSVRLVYLNQSFNPLTSEELNLLRIKLGSRIICERFIDSVIGSILNTNFYDYRVFNSKIVNRGTSSLSLEIKLFKFRELDIDKKVGELCIRGFIIGKPLNEKDLNLAAIKGERVGSEGWVPTGIIGKFGNDGCFYED